MSETITEDEFLKMFNKVPEKKHLNFVYQIHEDELMDIQDDKNHMNLGDITDEQKAAFLELDKINEQIKYSNLSKHKEWELIKEIYPESELESLENMVENVRDCQNSTKYLIQKYETEGNRLRVELNKKLLFYQEAIERWYKEQIQLDELIIYRNIYALALNEFTEKGQLYGKKS